MKAPASIRCRSLRYSSMSSPATSIKPFIEAGIGVAAFSGTRVGDQNLGSSLNFEDRIGAGLKFANGQSVGIRAIHYSNAGLKQPNDGIESYSLFYKIPI